MVLYVFIMCAIRYMQCGVASLLAQVPCLQARAFASADPRTHRSHNVRSSSLQGQQGAGRPTIRGVD